MEHLFLIIWIWGVFVSFDYIVNTRHKRELLDYHIVTIFATLSWLGLAMILTDDMVKRWNNKTD